MLKHVILFVLLLFYSGTAPVAQPAPAKPATCSQDRIRFGVIPKKPMAILTREYQPLIQYLSKSLDMPVEMVPAESYDSVVQALVSGGIDIAWLGPASYLMAYAQEPGIEAFASLTIEQGRFTPAGNYYYSILLVRSDSNIETVSQLEGKDVAFSEPSSTSGAILPQRVFANLGHGNLARFFGSLIYTGSHDRSIEALLDKRIDAAFVASVRADDFIKKGKMQADQLNVLWKSAPLHYDPYVFSASICEHLKTEIKKRLLNGEKELSRFLESQQAIGFAPVNHSNYKNVLTGPHHEYRPERQ
ncbi:MAG TPA: phosphate/phosphite/phosphonate ABC transporter substrate-binding protein [Pusillimonas sp.]|jgi:phosphonate transport system substrate-binding protein|nr:phosphate/phosphite/phosphonate ABC transporter substrate-binding protein [Pusillimonas sp.]|tara:strand:- start:4749 stop:5654 length:906 start_codon:yes stop_codon:yes gene_type:complete